LRSTVMRRVNLRVNIVDPEVNLRVNIVDPEVNLEVKDVTWPTEVLLLLT